jgi:hypothetical protein
MRRFLTAAFAVLFVSLVADGADAGQRLTPKYGRLVPTQALKALFPGRFEAIVQGGYHLSIDARRNGTLKARAILGISDKGRWVVRRSDLCIAFAKWTKGKAKCGTVRQAGAWYIASKRGTERFRFKVQPARLAAKRR